MKQRATYEPGWSGGDAHPLWWSDVPKPDKPTIFDPADQRKPILWKIEQGQPVPLYEDRRIGFKR